MEENDFFRIPTVDDPRGNLSFLQKGIIPFDPTGVAVNDIISDNGLLIALHGKCLLKDEGVMLDNPARGFSYRHRPEVIPSSPAGITLNLFERQRIINDPKEDSEPWKKTIIEDPVIDTPFHIKRTYYIWKIPEGAVRGGHSHFRQEVLIVALRGKMRVMLDDGVRRQGITLDKPTEALYVAPQVWRSMDSFENDCVVLVLSSTVYDPSDYVYDYELFKRLVARKKK